MTDPNLMLYLKAEFDGLKTQIGTAKDDLSRQVNEARSQITETRTDLKLLWEKHDENVDGIVAVDKRVTTLEGAEERRTWVTRTLIGTWIASAATAVAAWLHGGGAAGK